MAKATAETLSPEGAYLLDNGQELLLWLGRNLSREFIQDVFKLDAHISAIHISHVKLFFYNLFLSNF